MLPTVHLALGEAREGLTFGGWLQGYHRRKSIDSLIETLS
jgi:hypothetical protein